MTFQEFDNLIQRYIRGQTTADEEKLMERWFATFEKQNPEALEKYQQAVVERKLWNRLQEKNNNRPGSGPRFLTPWNIGRMAAALLLVAISLAMVFNRAKTGDEKPPAAYGHEKTVLRNSENKAQKIMLSDGSSVWLEPGSELSYFQGSFATNREVYLAGEAFFEVAKDRRHPFFVYTSSLTTQVLGTSFRVKAYVDQNEIIVSVNTGKVSVYRKDRDNVKADNKKVVLTPNQQVIYNIAEDNVAQKLVDKPLIVLAEPTLKTYYHNVKVAEIFDALEKNYGVDIDFNEDLLKSCAITTSLADESLYYKIEVICQVIGAHYSINGTSIIVESEGCE